MPKPKNTVARVVVPIVGVGLMALVGWAFYQNSLPSQQPPAQAQSQPQAQSTPSTAAVPAATPQDHATPAAGDAAPTTKVAETQPAAPASAAATTPEAPKADSQANASPASTPAPSAGAASTPIEAGAKFRARTFAGDPAATNYAPLGTLEPSKDDPTRMLVEFSSTGGGIRSIRLADYFETIEKKEHLAIQEEQSVVLTRDESGKPLLDRKLTPFGAISVRVNGQNVLLIGSPVEPVWRQIDGKPGHFEAIVEDELGHDVLRVERTYSKIDKAFDLKLTQRVTNLSAAPVKAQFFQIGPVDMPRDRLAYVGDRRRLHFGYLLNATGDPSQSVVVSDGFLIDHTTLMGGREGGGTFKAELEQWPNDKSKKDGLQLVWAGMTNRYFGVAVMPDYIAGTSKSKVLPWVSSINRVVLDLGLDQGKQDLSVAGLRLDGAEALLDPAGGASSGQDLSQVIYAGPLDGDLFQASEPTKSLGLTGLIVHNMGGPCSFCTFGWLTGLLLWLLQLLHSVSHDWAISIMLLVLVVRTCLHPVTKWSQIRMTRFGKQMQNIGPKMKVLQEKYKDDKVRLQQETGRLWKEEGISPTGMLGCLPMFFQMPVWIALYATLFFAVELRHQPAFFGMFQAIQPGSSPLRYFFADLAEPDRLWYWGTTFKIPVVGWGVSSLNIMPFVLGVVFFVQQKYLKPPTTATLTPEQESQQKMVQAISVVMFPLMMYPAPSGLTLYFCTNSVLSILENRYIRRHIDELDKSRPPTGGKPGAKGGEKTGFMAKWLAAAEAKRREMEEAQAKALKNAKKKR